MGLPVVNFGKVTVSTGYDAAATSIVLTSGHGSKLPATTLVGYLLVWWDSTTYSDPSDDPNVEIVKVTARSGDTLTVVRGQDGTAASTKNTASKTYRMILALTKGMYESLQSNKQSFRNLRLRTHVNVGDANSKTQFWADSITMDDGEEIDSWDGIVTDIATAGAGGLDTGSEAASTWYEQYAIRKRSDGTKNGLLHRAKNYFLDEESSAGEDGQHLLRDAAARTALGQGFQVNNAGKIEIVDVKIAKVGTPSGGNVAYWLQMHGDSSGLVNESDIKQTSDKYDATRLPTTSLWVRLPFRTNLFGFSAATQYHLTLRGDFTISGSNHLLWRADTSAAAYANGAKQAFDGATWTQDTDDDFMFKIYVTQNDAAVTMPSGYDQKCLIGYVCNDGSSNFKAFTAFDRTISTSRQDAPWKIGTTSAVVLFDLSAFIPPVPVLACIATTTGSAGWASYGHQSATDIGGGSANIKDVKSFFYDAATATSTIPFMSGPPMPLEYQGMMANSNGVTAGYWLDGFTW